jgi:glucose-1-phosphate adenylyltransferase
MNVINTMRTRPKTQAFILAGGQGERLFPLTVKRPKPAIPFGGSFRIIDFTLSNCLRSNLNDVSLLTQYRHHEMHSYIRQEWMENWNNSTQTRGSLTCLAPVSGKRYRGTADAIFQNLQVIEANRPDYVVVLSGDHVYEMDYREMLSQHVEKCADVTIAAIEHPLKEASQFGVLEVEADFKVRSFTEKPSNPPAMASHSDRALVSMGVYVFNTRVLVESLMENCSEGSGYDFGHNIIPSLIPSGSVYAFDFRDDVQDAPKYWRDIGTIDSYYQASMDFVRHSASASQVTKTVISPGVRIQEGAIVDQCVLMPGASVGRGAALRRVIVEEGVEIPEGAQIGFDIKEDRKQYVVSSSGVVVVSEASNMRGAAEHETALRVVA